MPIYIVEIRASKTGALALETERRTYKIVASTTDNNDEIARKAIALAYEEGLEHVFVRKVTLEAESDKSLKRERMLKAYRG